MLLQVSFKIIAMCIEITTVLQANINLACGYGLASFPGLLRFYLSFAFTIMHGSGRQAKNGEGL